MLLFELRFNVDHRLNTDERRWRQGVAAFAAVLIGGGLIHGAGARAENEVRALWVVRTTLTSPAAIDTMVQAARAGGFNTLLVQVRGRADAYYNSALEPRPAALATLPSFDPLAATIAQAHEAGLQVHAWVNVNLVAGVGEMPSAPDHVVYRHPEWLMVPRALAEDLIAISPRSPEYLGRLTRYARSRPTELEGLYLSPIVPGAAEYTASVVRDIVQRYAVDGVHLDYMRYPTGDFDYSRDALTGFRDSVVADLSLAGRRQYDRRLSGEPLIYTQAFPERWRAFRSNQLTSLVVKVREAVKAVKPTATISAAVMPDLAEAWSRHLQDWKTWLERDLIDVVCPMAYTTDAATFVAQVAAARSAAGRHALWAGIGAYQLSSIQIIENVQAARRLGVGGIILFSYDSLTGPTRGPEYLSEVGRAAFLQ
jgi:uncharacterized lipoprotein YddW (UPF0748 family)